MARIANRPLAAPFTILFVSLLNPSSDKHPSFPPPSILSNYHTHFLFCVFPLVAHSPSYCILLILSFPSILNPFLQSNIPVHHIKMFYKSTVLTTLILLFGLLIRSSTAATPPVSNFAARRHVSRGTVGTPH